MKEKTKDERVKREVARLKKIFKDIPKDKAAVVDGAIFQAARLRIMLDDMWDDICEKGDIEMFSQSERTEPYERERPVARLFNSRDKNYQNIIKSLIDLLPKGEGADPAEELLSFVARGNR